MSTRAFGRLTWGLLSVGMRGTPLTPPPPLQFKESALRKQSLYLKFDPLLKDSPERPAPATLTAPAALTTSRWAGLGGGGQRPPGSGSTGLGCALAAGGVPQ